MQVTLTTDTVSIPAFPLGVLDSAAVGLSLSVGDEQVLLFFLCHSVWQCDTNAQRSEWGDTEREREREIGKGGGGR